MFDVLFFAIVAGFILTRLFKTLGKIEEGDESRTREMIKNLRARQRTESNTADINIASAFEASLSQKVRDIFDQARRLNPTFNAEQFYNKVTKVFEVIVKAFIAGDKEALKPLLSKDVFDSFSKEITRRKEAKEVHENTIIRIKEHEIIDANLNSNILAITVKIISEQINVVKDDLGNIITGNPSKTETVQDVWVFAKHLQTSSSIWELVETKDE